MHNDHSNFSSHRRSKNIKGMLFATLAASMAVSTPLSAGENTDQLAPSGEYSVYRTQAAQTPPMGWNPWNAFRTDVDEAKIRGSAEALVTNGLAQLGYRYVNIDDGWALQRLPDGTIRIRDTMFPSAKVKGNATGSFSAFTGFIHSLGLKAGLYTDIGRNTCAQRWDAESPNLPIGSIAERQVGSMDNAARDMKTIFADWNFDYVKIDACGVADYAPDVEPVQSGRYKVFPPYIVRGKISESNPAAVEALYAELGSAIRKWGGPEACAFNLRVGRGAFAALGAYARQPLAHQPGYRIQVGQHALQHRQCCLCFALCGTRSLERSRHACPWPRRL